jgi:hypothetical protein
MQIRLGLDWTAPEPGPGPYQQPASLIDHARVN